MRVLVTGGAGFIGSHIVAALTAAGHQPVVLDALLPSAHACPRRRLTPRGSTRTSGTARPWRRRCGEVDAVCHQAACGRPAGRSRRSAGPRLAGSSLAGPGARRGGPCVPAAARVPCSARLPRSRCRR
ncbi:NAD-dependent epimerase/dehydratase family protein [Streptomyces sp. NBC_01190]|uniref:NAD-dependent epimerase/dehydratase family protein n=1 Tax=Streptomyces sp. NBC_01190 TaxID=2903767 RepID=UPI003870749D|nr:NAD(P)-dependent oxidoreductase [Streptomyces sp. NBC_01190]